MKVIFASPSKFDLAVFISFINPSISVIFFSALEFFRSTMRKKISPSP